jgi:hypothetical protein
MSEQTSKGAELKLEAFLRESAEIFNQWVMTHSMPLPVRAIDHKLIKEIASRPLVECETILLKILSLFDQFSAHSARIAELKLTPEEEKELWDDRDFVERLFLICVLVILSTCPTTSRFLLPLT